MISLKKAFGSTRKHFFDPTLITEVEQTCQVWMMGRRKSCWTRLKIFVWAKDNSTNQLLWVAPLALSCWSRWLDRVRCLLQNSPLKSQVPQIVHGIEAFILTWPRSCLSFYFTPRWCRHTCAQRRSTRKSFTQFCCYKGPSLFVIWCLGYAGWALPSQLDSLELHALCSTLWCCPVSLISLPDTAVDANFQDCPGAKVFVSSTWKCLGWPRYVKGLIM